MRFIENFNKKTAYYLLTTAFCSSVGYGAAVSELSLEARTAVLKKRLKEPCSRWMEVTALDVSDAESETQLTDPQSPSTGATVPEVSDEVLEAQIAEQYKRFKEGRAAPDASASVSLGVQFVASLLESEGPHTGRKLAMIISRGAGMGGFSKRSANDEERRILFTGIGKAKKEGVSKNRFTSPSPSPSSSSSSSSSSSDSSTLVGRHQTYVGIVYDALSSPFVNFAKDQEAYTGLNRTVQATFAVRTNNWEELAGEIPESVIQRVGQVSSSVTERTRIELTRSLLDLPKGRNGRSRFADYAFQLFCSYDDLYNRKVLWALGSLQRPPERQEFVHRLSHLHRLPTYTASSEREEEPEDEQHTQFVSHLRQFLGHVAPYNLDVMQTAAALVTIPPGERQDVVAQCPPLTTQWLTSRSSALKIVAETPRGQRAQFIQQILQFASSGTILEWLRELSTYTERQALMERLLGLQAHFRDNFSSILYRMGEVPGPKRLHVAEQVVRLSATALAYYDLMRAITLLGEISSDAEREALTGDLLRLLTPCTDATQCSGVMSAVAVVSVARCRHAVGQALRFSTSGMSPRNLMQAITLLGGTSSDAEREDLTSGLLQFLAPCTDAAQHSSVMTEVFNVISAATGVSAVRRLHVARQILRLPTTVMGSENLSQAATILGEISSEPECEAFTGHLLKLLTPCTSAGQCSSVMTEVANVMREVGRVPAQTRCHVAGQVLRLPLSVRSFENLSRATTTLSEVSSDEAREAFTDDLLQLLAPCTGGTQYSDVMSAAAGVAADRRSHVVGQTLRLPITVRNSSVLERVIPLLGEIPNDTERETLTSRLVQLVTPCTDAGQCSSFMSAIGRISADRRSHVAEQVLRLPPTVRGSENLSRAATILGKISSDAVREVLMGHLLGFLTPYTESMHQSSVMAAMAGVAADRLIHVAEQVVRLSPTAIAWYNFSMVTGFLDAIPSEGQREAFTSDLLQIHARFRDSFLYNMQPVPVDRRCHVAGQVVRLSATAIDSNDVKRAITLLGEISSDAEREALTGHLVQLLTPFKAAAQCSVVISSMTGIPADRRCHVARQVARLPIAVMTSNDIKGATALLGEISTDEACEAFAGHLAQLLTPCTNAGQCSSIMTVVAGIPADKRGHVAGQMVRLPLPVMGSENLSRATALLSEISTDEVREAFTGHLAQLLPCTDAGQCASVMDAVAGVPADKRGHVVGQILRLPLPVMGSENLSRATTILSEIPSDEAREAFAGHLAQLLTCTDAGQCASVMAAVAGVPVDKRGHVAGQLVRIMGAGVRGQACMQTADWLGHFPTREEAQTFTDHLLQLHVYFNEQAHRDSLLTSIHAVPAAQRMRFVTFVMEHQVLLIADIAALSSLPNAQAWCAKLRELTTPSERARGVEKRRERGRYRGDVHRRIVERIGINRTTLIENVHRQTIEEVNELFDRMPLRVNRTVLVRLRIPELSNTSYTAAQAEPKLRELIGGLNLTDGTRPDYLSEEILADIRGVPTQGEQLEPVAGPGSQALFEARVLPRLSRFVKTLWDIPLAAGVATWPMYDEQKPSLRQAVSYAFEQMINADSDTRLMQFIQLAYGFLRCQTGQKEGIDSLVQSLGSQRLVNVEDFRERLGLFLAFKKNEGFREAMLPKDSEGNVHVASHYHTLLSDQLGLSSCLEDFEERMGLPRRDDGTLIDPFGGDGNALHAFYGHVNPAYLIDVLHRHVQTKADFALQDERRELGGRIRRESDGDRKTELRAQQTALKQMYGRMKTERPFNPTDICNDLRESGHLSAETAEGWERYFTDDPLSGNPFELTRDGARHYLLAKGILVASPLVA